MFLDLMVTDECAQLRLVLPLVSHVRSFLCRNRNCIGNFPNTTGILKFC